MTDPKATPETLATIKMHIDSALNWHEVFDDGRGQNNLTKAATSEMLCRRLIAALSAPAERHECPDCGSTSDAHAITCKMPDTRRYGRSAPAERLTGEAVAIGDDETDWRKIAPELDTVYAELCSRLKGSDVDGLMEYIARVFRQKLAALAAVALTAGTERVQLPSASELHGYAGLVSTAMRHWPEKRLEHIAYFLDGLSRFVSEGTALSAAPAASGAEQVGRAFTVEMIEHEAKEWLSTGLLDDSDKRAVTSFVKWLSALVPIAEKGEDWQPISTAPKDGTSFLACIGNWMTVGHWHRYQQCWATGAPVYSRYPVDEQPTHWRPLPAPPLSHQSKEG